MAASHPSRSPSIVEAVRLSAADSPMTCKFEPSDQGAVTTRTEREILRPLAARCVRVAAGGEADGLEFRVSTVVLGVAGRFVTYDGFITRVRASCEFGCASVFIPEVGS